MQTIKLPRKRIMNFLKKNSVGKKLIEKRINLGENQIKEGKITDGLTNYQNGKFI